MSCSSPLLCLVLKRVSTNEKTQDSIWLKNHATARVL